MSTTENTLIKTYLDQVRKKLPEWLKWKSDEIKKILDDLEIQIMNQAQILAGGNAPSDSDIQKAIDQMGSPESIARPYKNRGTPKFYLTQELFEFYLRTLFIFFGIIILINIIIAVFKFVAAIIVPSISVWEALGSMFGRDLDRMPNCCCCNYNSICLFLNGRFPPRRLWNHSPEVSINLSI